MSIDNDLRPDDDVVVHAAADQQKLTSRNKRRSTKLSTPSDASSPCDQNTLTPPPRPMTSARTIPLLICSVGNPGAAYANTLHSAGHTVLNRLAEHLGHGSFQKDRAMGNGLVSTGRNTSWTLWQSTAFMNSSGIGVRAAWKTWIRSIPDGEGKLVIIHDELEKPLGAVSLRTTQGASAKGHNGLKDIMTVLAGDPHAPPFARIGVGIGRPASRESDDVARYVLRKTTPAEKAKIDASIPGVVSKLEQLERG